MRIQKAASRALLALGVAMGALAAGTGAYAAAAAATADANGPASTTTTEGVEVSEVVVRVEANKAAAAAPSKANILETQPESIITHRFIELATPETGDYTTTVLIAPSMAGLGANGGGVGETNKTSLRGFKDGQYNLTYDGIFFGDTNDPTHHPASFWPSSTIGAAVVDRGPGAAGDLGQANYGGAIHFFSPEVAEHWGASQKVTYGSFNTQGYVTTLNSGQIARLGGAKFLLNFDERSSDGELSYSGGMAQNQLFKGVIPFGEHYSLTLFGAHNWTRFYQSDAANGATWDQVLLFGKDYALNNDPKSEHYYKNNWQKKQSDFEYIDFKGEPGWGVTFEDQAYTYFYSNKTLSANDATGFQGPDQNGVPSGGVADGKASTDSPSQAGLPKTDLGGYDKGNRYRVYGDILRVNKHWSFGTLKIGGVLETSTTDRHNLLLDLTQGVPDNKYSSFPPLNAKTLENSSWHQYQLFADFVFTPTSDLTITPGIKKVHLTREISGLENSVGSGATVRGEVAGSNTYDKTLYFGTINYRILPYWSVYGQYATGFLIPALSTLQVSNLDLNQLKPQQSVNYQFGTVYTRGRITADADVYTIKVSNLAVADPTGQFFVNAGDARYSGVEGEGAYAFDFGLTLFANGSLNSAQDMTSGHELANAPKWTYAGGAIYAHGPWQGDVTYKQVGKQAYTGDHELPAYSTLNGTLAYDFGRFKLKLSGFNLLDDRSVTAYSGTDALYTSYGPTTTLPKAAGFYYFQAGRQLQVTLQAKF